MARPRGLPKTGGRSAGTPNKADKLRSMVLRALDGVGGQQYLERQAELNPGPFLSLVSKCLPREVHQEITAEMTVRAEVRRELVERVVTLMRVESETIETPVARPMLASQRSAAPVVVDGRERGVMPEEEAASGPIVMPAGTEAAVQNGTLGPSADRTAGPHSPALLVPSPPLRSP